MQWNFSRRPADVIVDWVGVFCMVALIGLETCVLLGYLAPAKSRPHMLIQASVSIIACLYVIYRVGSRIVRDFREEQ